jgi:hypothetical protein
MCCNAPSSWWQFLPSQVECQEAQRLRFTERAPRTVPNLGCAAKFVSGADGNQMEGSRLKKPSVFSLPPKFSTFYLSLYPHFNHLSSYSTFIKYGGRSSRSCQFSFVSHAITSLIVDLTPQVIDNGSGMCKAGCKRSADFSHRLNS